MLETNLFHIQIKKSSKFQLSCISESSQLHLRCISVASLWHLSCILVASKGGVQVLQSIVKKVPSHITFTLRH